MSSNDKNSTYEVVMPRLGLTMTEGKIVEWYKADGENVEKGEPLFSIENEKATLDIEAPASGNVKILVAVDVVVPILTPVAWLMKEGSPAVQPDIQERVKLETPAEETVRSRPEIDPRQQVLPGNIVASPRARVMARKMGIDLTTITGSGIRGMIVEQDILQAESITTRSIKVSPLARRKAAEAGVDLLKVKGSGPRGMIQREDIERYEEEVLKRDEAQVLQPLSTLRTIIANRLGASWMERPQVTLTTEVDASALVDARRQMNQELQKKGIKLSYNTLLIKLVSMALKEFGYMNTSLLPEGIVQHQFVNIGLAVDTEQGLMVPVLHDTAHKNHQTIHNELGELIDRTIQGKNRIDDLNGGTFTITNLGTFEIDAFTPIINPPECAILGVGRIHEKPVVLKSEVVVRHMMALSLSFDHRLVDGVPAARFLQRIKQFVEQPFLWSLWDK